MTRHLLRSLAFCLAASGGLFAQMLYVGNSGDDTISTYVINEDTGLLVELKPRLVSTGSPSSVAIHPSGKFAYVTNGGNANLGANGPSLATFSIDPATGALTLANTLALIPGSGPQGAAVDAAGKFLFVVHGGPGNVSVYALDPNTGTPSAISGSPFTTPAGPNKILIHPSGKFAFVTCNGAGQVAAFSIASDGALTPVAGSPFTARNNISWATMDAAGKFLFVAERQQNGVLVYAIDASTGALTPVPGSPFSTSGAIQGVAVEPSGKYLYASNGGGTLHGFRIGAAGALTPIPPGFFPSQPGSFDVIADPSGKFVYVTSSQADSVTAWSIDPATGALAALPYPPFDTGFTPLRGAAVLLNPPIAPPIVGNGVTNFFSYAVPGMPDGGVAQGSKLAFFGENIGPGGDGANADVTLAPELAGVSIQIQSGGVTTAALPVSASATFVSAVVPSSTPLGDATVTLTYNGRSTAPLPTTIVPASVGIRTNNNNGNGPARAWNATPDVGPDTDLSTVPRNLLNQPAKPGQTMVVQATGFGPIDADETSDFGQIFGASGDVIVGNKHTPLILDVRVAGGVDFFAFQIPADAPEGCYVPLAVTSGGVTSNVASISISSTGGSCSDPTALSAADLDTARRSGGLNIVTITLQHNDFGEVFGIEDRVEGFFTRLNAGALFSSSFAAATGSGIRNAFGPPPLGSCTVSPGTVADPGDPLNTPGDPVTGQFVNFATALNINGPQGALQLPPPNYNVKKNGYLTPGGYTVDNGAGTQAFGPFKASLTMPPPISWTTAADLTAVDRTQPLTVTWTGGAAGKEFALIVGISASRQASVGFLCAEKIEAGQFTVPAWVLSSLPATAVFDQSPGAVVGVGTAPLTAVGRFSAPGFDFGLFTYAQAIVSLANFQ